MSESRESAKSKKTPKKGGKKKEDLDYDKILKKANENMMSALGLKDDDPRLSSGSNALMGSPLVKTVPDPKFDSIPSQKETIS